MIFGKRSKEAFPVGILVFFKTLGWSRSLWTVPWQQPAEKQQALITLDLNHFGFRGRGGQMKRKDKRRKNEERKREPRIKANLNGGELNREGLKYPKGVSKLRQIKH